MSGRNRQRCETGSPNKSGALRVPRLLATLAIYEEYERHADRERRTTFAGTCGRHPSRHVAGFFVEGREISVFRREQNWFAIDNHCPHSGASLAAGKCGESVVTCGWHHWQFDLRTGEAIGRPGFKVGTHMLEVRDGELWITLSSEPEIIHQHEVAADSGTPANAVDEAVDWREASRCLVRYGAMT